MGRGAITSSHSTNMKQQTFPLSIRSRNISCKPLKELTFPIKVIYRMGSTTPTYKITKQKHFIEINSTKACQISANKILMKTRFQRGKIPTAEWFVINPNDFAHEKIIYYLSIWKTIIIKHKCSSKGNGIYLIKSLEDYYDFLQKKEFPIDSYVCEKYYTYSREYRLHVTTNGCFYAGRKMLKNDAKERWHRHGCNSVWIYEDNPLFDKPTNWKQIELVCINALKALNLDIAAFDVKVQNNKHENPKFIILESNSAPALGELGIIKYKEIINNYVNHKMFN